MLNRICLIGSVWEMPKVLDSASGFAVVFPMAVFDRGNGCQAPPHLIADWYRVVAADELGRCCDKCLQCGNLIYVEGSVQSGSVVIEQPGYATMIESRCQVVAESVMILSDRIKTHSVVR